MKNIKTKNLIEKCNLIIAEVSNNSMGLGIELGWAESTSVPILCIYKIGYAYSSSLKFISDNFIEYIDENDMIYKIEKYIKEKQINCRKK